MEQRSRGFLDANRHEADGKEIRSSWVSVAADEPGRGAPALLPSTDALRFQPAEVVLKVGGKVTWTNTSTVVHTATGDPAKVADASNVELPPGAQPWDSGFVQGTGSFTQECVPGTYRYTCIPHENVKMFGTITVVP